jgi:hypothetical protein
LKNIFLSSFIVNREKNIRHKKHTLIMYNTEGGMYDGVGVYCARERERKTSADGATSSRDAN